MSTRKPKRGGAHRSTGPKPKRGGARRGTGPKPKAGVARSERRTLLLSPPEAALHDAAASASDKEWPDWIRRAAGREVERQAIVRSADEGLISTEERDSLLAAISRDEPVDLSLLPIDVGFDILLHPEMDIAVPPDTRSAAYLEHGHRRVVRGELEDVVAALRAAGYSVRTDGPR